MQKIQSSLKKRQLQFLVKKLKYLLNCKSENVIEQIEILTFKIKKRIRELSQSLTSSQLRKILGTTAFLIGISFNNQASAQSFASPQINPFGLVSVYEFASPAFADLDGDGDMDLLVNDYRADYQYFENVGSSSNPLFTTPVENPFGLTHKYNINPSFVDIDADGDMDLFAGNFYGKMLFYENTGSASTPLFSPPIENPFGILSDYYWPFHDFADLDADGDMDLLKGIGTLLYYENTGTATSPAFAPPVENPFSLYYENWDEITCPAFDDLDIDGDQDLLVFGEDSDILFFENTGSSTSPQFAEPLLNALGLDPVDYTGLPSFADLDGDGDSDLLVGVYNGDMAYYENTLLSDNKELSLYTDVTLFPNPVGNELHIESGEKIENVEIYDMQGKRLAIFNNVANRMVLGNLPSGIYTVKISFKNGNYVLRKIQK